MVVLNGHAQTRRSCSAFTTSMSIPRGIVACSAKAQTSVSNLTTGENIPKESTMNIPRLQEQPHRWDEVAECYVIDTPSGTRPSDPVVWKLKTSWEGWEVTRLSPDGPFSLMSYCLETGLTTRKPRTFASQHNACHEAIIESAWGPARRCEIGDDPEKEK